MNYYYFLFYLLIFVSQSVRLNMLYNIILKGVSPRINKHFVIIIKMNIHFNHQTRERNSVIQLINLE